MDRCRRGRQAGQTRDFTLTCLNPTEGHWLQGGRREWTITAGGSMGCAPDGSTSLDPVSIVCKVTSVDGRPAVKLSDNPEKATGGPSEIDRYQRVFGGEGRVRSAVHV